MNKREKGKYRLEMCWNGRIHHEFYTDKARALARKEELANYRDKDDPLFSPFTQLKIDFIPEDKLPIHR